MPTPDWNTGPEWDLLVLGGKAMPGVARVEVDIGSGLDVQKGKGSKKARVRDTGTPPAELDIEIVLRHSEMAALEAVLPLISPRAATAPKSALSIVHPNAKLWGVNVVKIGRISSPMPRTGGVYVLKIKAIEHIDEPKKVKKPTTNTDKGDWNVQPKIDALQSSPANSGAPEANFSENSEIPGTGF
jgi:hypothetical protein